MTRPQYPLPGRRVVQSGLALLFLTLVFLLSGAQAVVIRITQFPLLSLCFIVLLLTINLWLVSFRFWRVLAHFGIRVPWAIASRASLAGHVGGLIMVSLFGQVMGRSAIMRNYGVSPVVNASLAGYERALLAIISGTLAFLGCIYLLGREMLTDFVQRVPLYEITLLVMASMVFSLWLGSSAFEARLSQRLLTRRNIFRILWIAILTAVGQVLVLGCFVLGVLAFRPEVPGLSVLAASAIISFAASLPITINGWGIRELAAVFVLGKLGISAADATTVSIVIGICSTLVVVSASVLLFRRTLPKNNLSCPSFANSHPAWGVEKIAAWLLSMAVALTIFFQFHVKLPAGELNLNLADPFAILALAAVSLHALLARQLPQWRIGEFNRSLLFISALLLLGFINGWVRIGLTQWALGGRLMGWLVLLGYLSAGYLVVAYAGAKGARRLGETLVSTAVIVVIWQAISRLLHQFGWDVGQVPTPNFEGYSGNRNAFAFQLLTVTAWLLAYTRLYARHDQSVNRIGGLWRTALLLSVILVGLVWTGSRAGIVAGAIMILAGGLAGVVERRVLIRGALVACMIWSGLWLVEQFVPEHVFVQSALSTNYSNQERWATFVHAVELWKQSPILGAGLGVFVEQSSGLFGHTLVIHSTPLWILAEFGLLGVVVLGWVFLKLARYALPASLRNSMPSRTAFLLLLLMFGIFSLVHEVSYQRILWLMMGALLALPCLPTIPRRLGGR